MMIFDMSRVLKTSKQSTTNKKQKVQRNQWFIYHLSHSVRTHTKSNIKEVSGLCRPAFASKYFLKQNLIKSLTVITFKAKKYYTCIYLLIIQVIDKNLKADVRSNTLPYSIRYTTIPRFIHE